jgi:hypothetical protein
MPYTREICYQRQKKLVFKKKKDSLLKFSLLFRQNVLPEFGMLLLGCTAQLVACGNRLGPL